MQEKVAAEIKEKTKRNLEQNDQLIVLKAKYEEELVSSDKSKQE
jgi:hypothetical protein